MGASKIAITLNETLVKRLDRLVQARVYPNRSSAVQAAVMEKLARLDRTRLARECAELNPAEEQALAEEGIEEDLKAWPEF